MIDLERELSGYRRKLPRVGEHLARLDDAQRDAFRYKSLALALHPREVGWLGEAPAVERADDALGAVLTSVALVLLWADLLEAKARWDEQPDAPTLGVLAGFRHLVLDRQRAAAGAVATREVPAGALVRANDRIAALLEHVEQVLATALAASQPRATPPSAPAEPATQRVPRRAPTPAATPRPTHAAPSPHEAAPHRDALHDALAELRRLVALPGLSAGAFGIDAEDVRWMLTPAEGEALATAPAAHRAQGDADRGALLRQVLLDAAAITFLLGRDRRLLVLPDGLDLPPRSGRTPSTDAADLAALADVTRAVHEIAARARKHDDATALSALLPVAERLDAVRRALAPARSAAERNPGTHTGRATTAVGARPSPRAPRVTAPVTRSAGTSAASPLLSQEAEQLARSFAQPGAGQAAAIGAVAAADSTARRTTPAGQWAAAGLALVVASMLVARTTEITRSALGPPELVALGTLAPFFERIELATTPAAPRSAHVAVDDAHWRELPSAERWQRLHGACELLSVSGYSSATFTDRSTGNDLGRWDDGQVVLYEPVGEPSELAPGGPSIG